MPQIANAVQNVLRGGRDQQSHTDQTDADLKRTSIFLGILTGIGFTALFVWAFARADEKLLAFSLGLLIFGGAALVGGVLGLLFGIPKSVSDPASAGNAGLEPGDKESDASRASYAVNTNLEQISDWLTKIIVGVGLIQIGTVIEQFKALASYFGEGFKSGSVATAAPVVAAAIIIYGLMAGFLAGYLLTRMFLPGAFNRADRAFRAVAVLRKRNTLLTTQIAEEREMTETAGRLQGEIYTDLYHFDQQGFRDAIAKLDELLKHPANQSNPALWTYLAAAHGQAYLWERDYSKEAAPTKEALLAKHRTAALDAVRNALALGDAWKPILQVMWDKNHAAKRGEGRAAKTDENDLEVFYDDPDFKELLGK